MSDNSITYIIKSVVNYQMSVFLKKDPQDTDIIVLPPLSVRECVLTTDQYRFIKAEYASKVIIQKRG